MKRNLLKDNITEMIILGAIILLGGILRIYTLGDRNLWMDEIAPRIIISLILFLRK